MKRILIVSGVMALLMAGFMAHPTGAPSKVCDNQFLEPIFHRDNLSAIPINNTNEYSLHAKPVQGNSDQFEVTLKPLNGTAFMGFVVRATSAEEKNEGKFITEGSDSFQFLSCSSEKDVAVTHVEPAPKSSITLLWEDKSNNTKPVFQATVVPDINSYVMNIMES